jgi:pimeloyl-ACP methyl ester carboxylesterase
MPFVHTGEIRIAYDVVGRGTETVLFVHGNLASRRWWKKVMSLLPSEGYQKIALDLRGCGQSDKPDTGYTIPRMAEDLWDFLRMLSLTEVHFVGHSLGGALALLGASDHPTAIKSLALIAPVPADGLLLPEELYRDLEVMRQDREKMREGMKSVMPAAEPDELQELVEEALLCHPACFFELPRTLATLDMTSRLTSLLVPTLIIAGERDPLIPLPSLERMCRRIPNCRLEVLTGIGHAPHIEAASVVADTLQEFWSRKDHGGKDGRP